MGHGTIRQLVKTQYFHSTGETNRMMVTEIVNLFRSKGYLSPRLEVMTMTVMMIERVEMMVIS